MRFPHAKHSMLASNEDLLKAYLGSRKVARSTELAVENGLKSFDRAVRKPLVDATSSELRDWYEKVKGLRSSSVFSYASWVRILYRWSLVNVRGLKKAAVSEMVEEAFDVIPLKDLSRQAQKEAELRNMLITGDEFKALMSYTRSSRLKALFAMLYDTACRKGELLSLRVRDVEWGDRPLIRVKGKTGERTLPLIRSLPYLKEWLQQHPDARPDNLLFVTERHGKVEGLNDASLNMALTRICRRAGIRHMHPHMLRHTKLTEYASKKLGDSVLKKVAGWTSGSRQPQRYIHLSGIDTTQIILEAEGIPIEKGKIEKKTLLELRACPRCGNQVGPDMVFCPNCSAVLDEEIGITRIYDRDKEIEELRTQMATMAKITNAMSKQLYEIQMARGDFNYTTRILPVEREGKFPKDQSVADYLEASWERSKNHFDHVKAMDYFHISLDDWNKLTDRKKKDYIDKLPQGVRDADVDPEVKKSVEQWDLASKLVVAATRKKAIEDLENMIRDDVDPQKRKIHEEMLEHEKKSFTEIVEAQKDP